MVTTSKLSRMFVIGACALALSCAVGSSTLAFADEAILVDETTTAGVTIENDSQVIEPVTAGVTVETPVVDVDAGATAETPVVDVDEDATAEMPVADVDADEAAETPKATDDTEKADASETQVSTIVASNDKVEVAAESATEVSNSVAVTEGEASASSETDLAAATGWVKSGSGWSYYENGKQKTSDWVVTNVVPGSSFATTDNQRYYVGANGLLVANSTFEAALAGTSSWFKSVVEGYVIRGVYTDADTGYVYIADNEGRLTDTGWYIADVYGDGVERYWIDEDAHACVPGYSEDGWSHYTVDKGYVVRGTYTDSDTGYVYVADGDGKTPGTGWVCGDYGYGFQRYWIDAATHACIPGYSTAGWSHVTTLYGYVARGVFKDPETEVVYLADGDGLAPTTTGWLCADYGRGFNRYWIDPVLHGCVPGYSTAGWDHWTLYWGAVLRGTTSWMQDKLFADNDGLLAHDTWVCTDAFGDGFQRYYAGSDGVFLYNKLITKAQGGYLAYATSSAAVARGVTRDSSTGYVYLADNDGKLMDAGWQVGDFGQGWHRYWIDATTNACIPGFSEDGWTHYTVQDGYVLTGKGGDGNFVLVATGDGVLSSFANAGWYVGSDYDSEVQRYYFTVVYTSPAGKSYYGAKVGLFTVDGKNYYGLENVGYVMRNAYRLVNNDTDLFYADNDGAQSDLRNGFLGKGSDNMAGVNAWLKVKNMTSSTQYLLVIDDSACAVFVFQGKAGAWTPIYGWDAGVGLHIYNDGQGTIKGTFTIGGDGACYNYSEGGNGGYRCEYYAKDDLKWFTGFCLDAGFHSTIGNEGGYSDPTQTGLHISHGCIRLLEGYAHWIYDNCAIGTKVYSY